MMFLLYLLLPLVTGKNFDFLVSNGEIHVASVVKNEPISVIYQLPVSATDIANFFDRIRMSAEEFSKLKCFQATSSFQTTFMNATQPGLNDFRRANEQLNHVYEFIENGTSVLPDSACTYDFETLDYATLDKESYTIYDLITDKINENWTVEDFTTDLGKLNLLESFIFAINSIGQKWRDLTFEMVNGIDNLLEGKIPVGLAGNL